MKIAVLNYKLSNRLLLFVINLLLSSTLLAQTYTTKANGAWTKASTWLGGLVPPNGTISSGTIINIRHIVSYSGSSIHNSGIINISNPGGTTPSLTVDSKIDITNNIGGIININAGVLRQYRFAGGGETGTPQQGNFVNNGGYFSSIYGFVEMAQAWTNQGSGTEIFNNSSLQLGEGFAVKNNSTDSLLNTSVSIGVQGGGDFTIDGGSAKAYFQGLRVEIASTDGKFNLSNGTVNGSIDYITLKNHITNTYSNNKIIATNKIITSGLILNAYCIPNQANYQPNGIFSGPQVNDCSLNYFPASLYGASGGTNLNFSNDPILIAGTDKKAGAKYKYENIAPGTDAIVSIDSIVGGATINKVDDNTGANGGYAEGFQPQITSGPGIGSSYAVFSFQYKISGTNVNQKLDNVSLTALDIDGTSTLKEFDQISMGSGAAASFDGLVPTISLSFLLNGTFMAINTDGITRNGVDTSTRSNMFTVANNNTSSFTAKLGIFNTLPKQTLRLFSIYMKGFNYPNLRVMPVTLQSFSTTLNNNNTDVNVSWVTATQSNVSHFAVERSIDGKIFSKAGIVISYGNYKNGGNYNFTDNISSLQANLIYYRLCTVDLDGRVQYSDIRTVRISKTVAQNISILTYPNPVSNELRIAIPSNWQNKRVSYQLFNVYGQLSSGKEEENSRQTETINVSKLNRGVYIVRVICDGKSSQQKVIKF